jgi:hypothetical protein
VKLPSHRLVQTSAFLFPICAVAFAACGGSSDSPTNPGTAGSAGSAGAVTGDPSKLVGGFQLKVTPASDLGAAETTLVGRVSDGPTPATTVWHKEQTEGDCTLSTPHAPFCSTPCGGSAACVDDDTCLAYPSARSVGVVTVTGVKAADGSTSFELSPTNNNYQALAALAYPPFAEGDAVNLSAAGADLPAFKLSSKGILPLALTSTELELKTGQPLLLTWTKGSESSAKIHVSLDISNHGGTKGEIACETADSGSLTISAALITKLLNLGVAGFPAVKVTRRVVGSAVIPAGRVELEISSTVSQGVKIEGLNSCVRIEDCPDGQSCQDDLTCK